MFQVWEPLILLGRQKRDISISTDVPRLGYKDSNLEMTESEYPDETMTVTCFPSVYATFKLISYKYALPLYSNLKNGRSTIIF